MMALNPKAAEAIRALAAFEPDVRRIALHGPNFPDERDETLVKAGFILLEKIIQAVRLEGILDDR